MDKGLLYKFFAGEASESEIETIKTWTEESAGNMDQLISERKIYDALQLSSHYEKIQASSLSSMVSRAKVIRFVRIALSSAAAAVLVSLGTLAVRDLVVNDEVPSSLNTIMVPARHRAHVTLADGPNVWLNAGPTLVHQPSSQ
ncbi:MAG: hypothetical protein MJZ16_03995, partial [Bacteroidales bacterium]|nr:hypothetical protein [Bacteroidales bacterium]